MPSQGGHQPVKGPKWWAEDDDLRRPVCHEDMGSEPCGKPAAGTREDPNHGGLYPVCVEHLGPDPRRWTIYVCGLGHAHGGQEASTTCSAAGREPVEVVPAVSHEGELDKRLSGITGEGISHYEGRMDDLGVPREEYAAQAGGTVRFTFWGRLDAALSELERLREALDVIEHESRERGRASLNRTAAERLASVNAYARAALSPGAAPGGPDDEG